MNPDDAHLHDLAGAYALNALSDEERGAFESHLDVCPSCAEEVADLLATTAAFGGMLHEPPSGRLRAAVMAEIERTPQEGPERGIDEASQGGPERGIDEASQGGPSSTADDTVVALRREGRGVPPWATWVGAAAAAVAAVVVVVLGLQLADANQRLDEIASERERMEALLAAPDARTVVTSDTEGGEIRLVVSVERGQAMLIASGMEPAPHEHVYEAWVIHGDQPVAAGLFDAQDDGRVTALIEGDFARGSAVGVTIEPEGGSPEPTTDPVMVVPLSG